jgi:hypothetical protein
MSNEFELKTLETRVDILSNIRRHQKSIIFSSQQFKRFVIIEMLDLRIIMILLKQLASKTFRRNIIFSFIMQQIIFYVSTIIIHFSIVLRFFFDFSLLRRRCSDVRSFFLTSWSDSCKIFKMMRSFTNESTMSISCETTTTISYFETSFSFFTRRNAFFWLSWCFRISDDWSSSRSWKALLTANTRASVLDEDKAFVLTVNSTCAREAMLLEI